MTGSSAAPAPPAPAQPRAGSHLSGRGSDNCDNWSRAAAAARWRLFLLSPINCVIYNKGGVTTDFHGVLLREYSAITPTPAPAGQLQRAWRREVPRPGHSGQPSYTDTASVTCTPTKVSRLPLSQVVCQNLPPFSTLPRRQDRSTQPMSTYLFTSRDFMTGLVRCCCCRGSLHAPGKKELIQTLRCLKVAARQPSPTRCSAAHTSPLQ